MSLCITFYNAHGIIMSADNMVCSTIEKDNAPYTYQSSETEQKLFLIENKYGLSYPGTSSIGSTTISAFLAEYINSHPVLENPPMDWLLDLAQKCNELLESSKNIVFILAGYYHSERFVVTTNTKEPKLNFQTDKSGLLYSGESKFVSHLINSNIIAFEYSKFTLQDAADFLRFLNKTISGLMRYGQYLPTVSSTCDTLAILPNESYWLEHLTLH